MLLCICDWPGQKCYCDNLHLIGTDADQGTVHVHYSLFTSTASLQVPATVMSKVTQHTRTSCSIPIMSKSESRGWSTSSASAVDQDVIITIEVKMLIVKTVTETEADGLRRIIEQ